MVILILYDDGALCLTWWCFWYFDELLYQHINPRWSSPKLQKSLSKPWLKFAWCKFKIQGIKYARMQYEQLVDTYSNESCLLQVLCSDDDINTNKVCCSLNSWSLMMLMVHTVCCKFTESKSDQDMTIFEA